MHSTWRTLKPMALIVTKNNYLYYYLGDFLLPKKRSILFLKDMNWNDHIILFNVFNRRKSTDIVLYLTTEKIFLLDSLTILSSRNSTIS